MAAQPEPVRPNRTCLAAQHSLQITGKCRFTLGSFLVGSFLALIIGIVLFVLLLFILAFYPFPTHCYVENACLTQFNLTGTNLLRYDLYLNVSITNPSKIFQADYKHLKATANFNEAMIGLVPLPTFRLGHKKTFLIHPVFGGQSPIELDGPRVNEFMKQRSNGFFRLDVEIHADKTDSLGKLWLSGSSPRILCPLLLMPSNSSASCNGGFTRTECEVSTDDD